MGITQPQKLAHGGRFVQDHIKGPLIPNQQEDWTYSVNSIRWGQHLVNNIWD